MADGDVEFVVGDEVAENDVAAISVESWKMPAGL